MADGRVEVIWGRGPERHGVGLDAAQVDALLDRLDDEGVDRPFLVDIVNDAGDGLTIGVGDPRGTVLHHSKATKLPPYYLSHSDPALSVDNVWFDYWEAETEFSGENVVSTEAARAAVREFILTGRRSSEIGWVEA